MTGNISASSDRFASAHWGAASFYLCILVAFIVGTLASALFIHEGRRRAVRGVYALNILIEDVLMGVLAWAVLVLTSSLRTSLLVMGLSFLMGLQNAMVSTISGTRVRTTHISGTAKDLGIELAALMLCLVGRGQESDPTYASKLRLHLHTIAAFFLRGVAGILIYQAIGMRLLFCAALVLLGLSGTSTVSAQRRIVSDVGSP